MQDGTSELRVVVGGKTIIVTVDNNGRVCVEGTADVKVIVPISKLDNKNVFGQARNGEPDGSFIIYISQQHDTSALKISLNTNQPMPESIATFVPMQPHPVIYTRLAGDSLNIYYKSDAAGSGTSCLMGSLPVSLVA